MKLPISLLHRLVFATRLPIFTAIILTVFFIGLGVWAAVEKRLLPSRLGASVPASRVTSAPVAVPMLTVNKTATLATDVNGNTLVNPGDTLMYSVTVSNSGTDATNVVFTDQLNANLTLVGSATASPIATNDSYTSIGNVGITVNAANGVLANDVNPQGSGTIAVTAVPAGTTAQGGSFVLAANGSFTYNPPVGYEGADSFTYTLTHSNGKMDTATVNLTVSGMIWFVNNNAGACSSNCNGRLSNPFTTLAAFNTANVGGGSNPDNNDNIFVYESSTQYTGAVTLRTGQKLIGQDATATLATIAGITLPPFSNALPTMNTGAPTTNIGSTVTLNTNATVRGLSINSTTSTGMNDPASAITGVNVSEVNVATTTGTAVLLSSTGGTLSFTSISANGAANGISLTSTTGSFTVTGDGTNTTRGGNSSGGTIANATGANGATAGCGVYLNNVQNVTLRRLTINGTNQNFGIYGTNVTNFVMEYSTVGGINGNDTPSREGAVVFDDIFGSSNGINESIISGGIEDNFRATNMSGTLGAFNVTNNNILNNDNVTGGVCPTGCGNIGVGFFSRLTANMTVAVTNNTFQGNRTESLRGDAGDSSTINVNFSNNTFVAGIAPNAQGNLGINVSKALTSNCTFTVNNNKVGTPDNGTTKQPLINTGINIFSGSSAGTMSGTVNGNTVIQDSVNTNPGSGIVVNHSPTSTSSTSVMNVKVDGNQVGGSLLNYGMLIDSGGITNATGSSQYQVTNNVVATGTATVPAQAAGALDAIRVAARRSTNTCYRISGNTASTAGTGFFAFYLRKDNSGSPVSVMRIEGLTTGLQSDTTAKTYIGSTNTIGGPGVGADAGNFYTGVTSGTCSGIPTAMLERRGDNRALNAKADNATVPTSDHSPTVMDALKTLGKAMMPALNAISSLERDLNFSRLSNWLTPTAMAAGPSSESAGNASSVVLQAVGGTHTSTHPLLSATNKPILPAMFAGELITINGGGGGFTLPAGKSVTIMFNATISSSFTGTAITNQANVTAAGGINVNSNNSSTPVIQAPTITKSFAPTNIALSGTNQTTSTLTLTLTNPNAIPLSGVAFTDTFPAGLVVADVPTASVFNCGSPPTLSVSVVANAASVGISGGTIQVGQPCTLTLKVKGTTAGAKVNSAGGATATQATIPGPNSPDATLNVLTAPSFTKSFGAPSVALNGTTSLTFNITNNDATFGLTGVSFTDTLPAGLTVAATPNITGSCGGGTITAAANSGTISLSGASLAASGPCSFSVDVTGTTVGAKNNSVSLVTTETGTNSTPATATLNVFGPPTIAKAFVTSPIVVGQTSVLNITVTNPASNPGTLNGISFTDNLPAGITAPNSSTTSCGGGTLTVANNVIMLTGGSLASGANCVNTVTVTGVTAVGSPFTNTINSVSSTNGGTNSTPATANITVNKASTVLTALTDSPDPSVVGQPYTVGFTLNVTSPGAGTPTGTVSVNDGAGGTCTATLPATTCQLTSIVPGNKTVTFTYNGDANFNASPSNTAGHAVNKANTTTTITADTPDPSNPGASVTVNFTVVPVSPGAGTPTGNVTVSDGVDSCTGTVAAGGCNLPLNTPGNRTLTATYAGDTNFNGSASAGEPHQVAGPPTLSKSFTPTQIKVNETSVMTFTISNPNAALNLTNLSFSDTFPAGLVVDTPVVTTNTCGGSFSPALVGGENSFTYTGGTRAGGAAPCTISVQVKATTAGVKPNTTSTITATETSAGSAGNATLTVVGAPVLTKSFSPNSIFFGQSSTLSFNITNNNPTVALSGIAFTDTLPAGMTVATSGPTPTCGGMLTTTAPNTISFSGGTLAAGSPNPTSCSFSVNVTPSMTGALINTTGAITSIESGAGATAQDTLTVNKPNTTTTITNAASLAGTPTVIGQSYAVNVTVAPVPPGMGTPSGTVMISDGTGATCNITLSSGSGSCNLTSTSTGVKTISATYGGDLVFNGSNNTTSHTVNKANTTLSALTDSPDPSVVGQAYTAGFTLNVTAPGAGTPSGTVSVSDGAGGTCTATLPATSCQLTSIVAGNKTVTFTYNGDANFNTSTNTAGHAVNKANTTVAITNDTPDPSVIGQNYAVTAAVSVSSPGTGSPTGTITVTDGTNNCTITLPGTSCNLPSNSVGAKTLTATYNGDTNYNTSPASPGVPHTVNKADVTVAITSDSPDSSQVGQNVTVNFSVTAAAPGAGTPTGNVTVSDGVNSCTGTVAAGSCVVALSTPGSRTLTASYAGDANFNSGTSPGEPHTVVAPPTIAKSFSPGTTPVNGTSQLTITITNPATNTVALTGVGFTDAFPNSPNLVVATPLTVTNTCGGTLTDAGGGTLTAGDTGIRLNGGTVNTGTPCTITVNVTPTAQGPFVNLTGNVTATNGGTGNTATATLATNQPPTINPVAITRSEGSPVSNSQIATVNDPDDAKNLLAVLVNGAASATVGGITINNLQVSNTGAVTADVVAACGAGTTDFTLRVTDPKGSFAEATLSVTVTPNTPPTLTYQTTVAAGLGQTLPVSPATGPADNGSITNIETSASVGFSGTVQVDKVTGIVTINNAGPLGTHTINVKATDNCGLMTQTSFDVIVIPFIVQLSDPLFCTGDNVTLSVHAEVTNPNTVPANLNFNASIPPPMSGVANTCTSSVGNCTITANGVNVTGTLQPKETVLIDYKVRVANGTPQGTKLCIDSTASFNGGPPAMIQACTNFTCPGGVRTMVSDQKQGSVLVFPYYTSKLSERRDTRLTLSNVGTQQTYAHVFLLDGVTCQPADFFVCLTPNASLSFKASEYDPETTGWLLVVAINNQGRPIQNNSLVGNAFVSDGEYQDNYGAEAFRANSAAVAAFNGTTATLFFDGTSYDAVPNQFAVELQSPVTVPVQRIVTVGLRGDLSIPQMQGAGQIGTGLVINGNERPSGSFTNFLNGNCQATANITNSSPRVPSGMNGVIPAGQVGTLQMNVGAAVGLVMTPRTTAFGGIRPLHKTAQTTSTITIPVFAPVC